MKKIKKPVIFLALLMSVVFFASCKKEENAKVELTFIATSIALNLNEEKNLSELVTVKNANLNDLQFISSNTLAVVVTPDKKIKAIGEGASTISVYFGEESAHLSVGVSVPLQKFDKVKGSLKYDYETSTLKWDHAFVIKNGQTIGASAYNVYITKNNQTSTVETSNNFIQVVEEGQYSVVVSAKANGFAWSDYSQNFSFSILEDISNFTFNKNTKTLSWNRVEGASKYIISINQNTFETTNNSYQLPINTAGEYKAFVRAEANGIKFKPTQSLTIVKLETPEVKLEQGLIKVGLSQANLISKFKLFARNASNSAITYNFESTNGIFSLPNVAQGDYFITIDTVAVANGFVYDAETTSSITIKKLASSQISFDKNTKTITLDSLNNVLFLENILTGEVEKIDVKNTLTYVLNKEFGSFKIYSQKLSSNDEEINSDFSHEIYIKVLNNTSSVGHHTTNGKSYITFPMVQGAEGYSFTLNDSTNLDALLIGNQSNLVTYELSLQTNELFAVAGSYNINVNAYDNNFALQGYNYFVVYSGDGLSNNVEIIRLGNSGTLDYTNGLIAWGETAQATSYKYILEKNAELLQEGQLNVKTFATDHLRFGNYKFTLTLLGDGYKVLDSLTSNSVNFSVKETLASAYATFDSSTNILTVVAVENADRYIVYYDTNIIATLNLNNLSLNLSTYLDLAGTHNFYIVSTSSVNSAENDGSGNLFNSEKFNLRVVRLNAVESVTYNEDGSLVIEGYDTRVENIKPIRLYGYKILLNDIAVNLNEIDLSQERVNVLKITRIPNYIIFPIYYPVEILYPDIENNLEKIDISKVIYQPVYYLNSHESVFTLEKLETPTELTYENMVMSWKENLNATNYVVTLFSGELSHQVTLTNNFIDLTPWFLNPEYTALVDNGFEFSVKYNVNNNIVYAGETGFISSLTSSLFEVKQLEAIEIETVLQNGNEITIQWKQILGASEYEVVLNGNSSIVTTNEFKFVISATTFEYNLVLTAHDKGYISSKSVDFKVVKLQAPTAITVSQQEKFVITNIPQNALQTLVNAEVYQTEIDLVEMGETGEYLIQFIGAKFVEGVYYLDSEISTFEFERHNSITGLKIENDIISWNFNTQGQQENFKYQLQITRPDGEKLQLVLNSLNNLNQPNITLPLWTQEILSFATVSGQYQVEVRTIINNYELLNNDIGYLNGQFSQKATFDKLVRVENLSMSADAFDVAQKVVTISWDTVENANAYEVFVNSVKIETVTTNSFTSDYFSYENSNNGEFSVTIIAKSNHAVNSEFSQPLIFNRLKAVNQSSLYVSENGEFSWGFVYGNKGYSVYHKKQNSEEIEQFFTTELNYDFSNQIFNNTFFGNIEFFVLAIGDAAKTLSSEYSVISKVKLDAPEITLTGDSLLVNASLLNPDAMFKLVVYFVENNQEQIVYETLKQTNEALALPNVWKLNNVEITQNGVFRFEVYFTSIQNINSEKTSTSIEKLKNINIIGFEKLNTEKHEIVFKVDASKLLNISSIEYVLKIKNLDFEYVNTTSIPNNDGLIVFEVKDMFDYSLYSTFTITVQARADQYLDSKIDTLSGIRLNYVSGLGSKNGVLGWDYLNQAGAKGYLLKIYHSENQDGTGSWDYINKTSLNLLSDELIGISGVITANIKAIGNVPVGSALKQNVVLDSAYVREVEYLNENGDLSVIATDKNFVAKKLKAPTNAKIENGMFVFNRVEDATSYVVRDINSKKEYAMNYFAEQTEESLKGLSENFYQGTSRLLVGTDYTLALRAMSNQIDVLNSDSDSSFVVRILPNPNQLSDDVKYEWRTDNKDYVKFSWNSLPAEYLSNNQFLVDLQGMIIDSGSGPTSSFISDSSIFSINTNTVKRAGTYSIRVRVLGSSTTQPGGYYYLASAFSPRSEFKKLDAPTLKLENGIISWNKLDDATAYVIYYMSKNNMDDVTYINFTNNYSEFNETQTRLYWEIPESFSSLTKNNIYYIGIKAINTNSLERIAPSHLGVIYQEGSEETIKPLIMLKAPDDFEVIDGAVLWRNVGGMFGYNFDLFTQSLKSGTSPFVYTEDMQKLFDYMIKIKITNSNGYSATFTREAVKLFYAKVFDQSWFKNIAVSMGFDSDYKFGFPSLNEFITELGINILPGENHISALQLGNSDNWLNSRYNEGVHVYVPHKVNARMSSSKFEYLEWDEVHLTGTKTYNAQQKYMVIMEESTTKRTIIHTTNALSVNLRELVDADKLLPGIQKLYVMVVGDDGYYTNGIPSNPVEVYVLPSVSARLNKGILNWDALSHSSSFNIKANPNNSLYYKDLTLSASRWEFDGLSGKDDLGQVLEYNLSIRAMGNGLTVLSGKETFLGKITKLDTPQATIEQGRFVWGNITNNFGYEVFVMKDKTNQTVGLNKDKTNYESTISGFNNYNFRTYGSTAGSLDTNSSNFAISSYMLFGIDAVMLNSVENFSLYNGNVVWKDVKDFNGLSITEFKFTFDSINHYPELFINQTQFRRISIEGQESALYEVPELYLAGDYKLFIQAYSNQTYYNRQTNKTYQYLLGEIVIPASELEFTKLKNIYDIKTNNGVITWKNDNLENHDFKVVFTRGSEKVEFITTGTTFDVLNLTPAEALEYAKVIAGQSYSISIQARGNNEDLVSSDFITATGFIKVPTISDVDYIRGENTTDGFKLRWYLPSDIAGGATDYDYIIRFSPNGENGEFYIISSKYNPLFNKGYSTDEEAYYGEIDVSYLLGQNSTTLAYYIAVVPISEYNLITSSYSSLRTVSPPKSLDGNFVYMENERKFVWTYEGTGTDVSFRIIDELVTLNEDGEVTVIKTNVYSSQLQEFYPQETGLHRISISVVLYGKEISSSFVYFKLSQTMAGIINSESFVVENGVDLSAYSLLNFNLFEAGDGNSENPYIITTQSQFENINYRLQKPAYLGSGSFYFKQNNNLNLVLNKNIGDFAGVYDGGNFNITYHYKNDQNQSSVQGGLFKAVLVNGIIKNVSISATIEMLEKATVNVIEMSALAVVNRGLIENVIIKNFTYISKVNKGINYYIGGIAFENYGTISNSINKANITLNGGTAQLGLNSSSVFVGGIVYSNYSVLSQVGNQGNISVSAKTISIGGVAANTINNSRIEYSYNKGNINATFALDSSQGVSSNFGGLVAINNAVIIHSYSVALEIKIDASAKVQNINVGGIAGILRGENGGNINNTYTTTTLIEVTNQTKANVQLGLFAGLGNANDLQSGVTSYYTASTGKLAINNLPYNLTLETISSKENLLSSLNLNGNIFESSSGYPVLFWEKTFLHF